jgi:hypothetical protein
MDEKKDNKENRRAGKDRRKGDLDDLFKKAVSSGAFEDRRKSDRRKTNNPEELKIRVYLN